MKYSRDRRIDDKVKLLVKDGWEVINTGKHPKLVAPNGRRLTVPATPSDHRAALNFLADVKRIS